MRTIGSNSTGNESNCIASALEIASHHCQLEWNSVGILSMQDVVGYTGFQVCEVFDSLYEEYSKDTGEAHTNISAHF